MGDSKYVDYLKLTPFVWKRPEGPLRVWRVVDGRKKMANGEIPKFSIQEVPEELKEDVIEMFVKHFLNEEVLCSERNLASDPVAIREFRTIWMNILKQGATIVALLANTDPTAKPIIAGANILTVVSVADDENASDGQQFRSEGVRKVCDVMADSSRRSDILRKYNVDKYLSGFGLSVHPDFRGHGLGEEILRARVDLGLAYQIPITQTIFSGPASQISASRAGFGTLFDMKYSEILDDRGNLIFPGVKKVKGESMKVMVKQLFGGNEAGCFRGRFRVENLEVEEQFPSQVNPDTRPVIVNQLRKSWGEVEPALFRQTFRS